MTPMISSTILRTQSDARLVELATGGHEHAFETIVERYRKPLMRYCCRYLPEGRAEDAVQQSFIKAWTAIQEGKPVANLRPWLYKIAHNCALDAAKRSGYDYAELSEALTLGDAPDAELERRRVIRETLTGVAALPENQREALLRTAVEGESRADIARQMGVSEGAVRQLVHRARATLRAGATALTPFPVAGWAAEMGPGGSSAPRIAELVGAVGAVGGGAVILKASAAAVIAGTIAAVGATGVSPITAQGEDTPANIGTRGATQPGHDRDGVRTAAAIGSLRGGAGEVDGNRRGARGSSPRDPNSGSGSATSGSRIVRSGTGSGTGTSGSGTDSSGSGLSSDDQSSGSGSGDGSSGSDDGSGSGSGDGSSGSDDSSGSGSSGSGSSSDDGSGSSGSGSGSDDVSTSGTSGSGSGDDGGHGGHGGDRIAGIAD